MADDLNRLEPAGQGKGGGRGDVPEHIRRRYFTDSARGPGLGFYTDAAVQTAAFRDAGRRLSTDRNDPHVIRDLVAIARHRGWSTIEVRGQASFRREAWFAARAEGLEVRGYRPTERDTQRLDRNRERRASRDRNAAPPDRQPITADGPQTRFRIVETVVRDRVADPAAQARILAAARSRLADWLERGARFDPLLARRVRSRDESPER
ncbi:MAG: transfer protein [Phenylobacterium sp.]|nr:transfer protein [Phenylobacterium sp.]